MRPRNPVCTWTVFLLICGLAGCAAEEVTPASTAAQGDAGGSDAAATGAADVTAPEDTTPPPGPPAPLAYAEECPAFDGATASLKANGFGRSVRVYLPDDPSGAGLLYLWHGLGDNAKNFATAMGAAALAKKYNLVVVAPDSCCNTTGAQGCCPMMTGWSYSANQDNDLSLFDGVLSCADQKLGIDRKRVYTAGFSAGALWSTWLTLHRSTYLAASAIFSGGINGVVQWQAPEHNVPVLDSSGGANDTFMNGLVNFQKSTEDLNANLRSVDDFVVHCQHSQGHTITADIAKFAFEFLAAHTWDGVPSPFAGGLPASAPAKCQIVP